MLNLSSSGGSGNYIRFMPSANAWLNNAKEEIQLKKVVFDIDNVQTGWMLLAEGARDWQPDAALGQKGKQPSPDHKRGFSVKFYNKELGTVEWSANGTGPNMGLEALYKAASLIPYGNDYKITDDAKANTEALRQDFIRLRTACLADKTVLDKVLTLSAAATINSNNK